MTESSTQQRPGISGWVILLLLIVILIALNLLYPLVANWQSVLTGDPGDLLYAAGFDGFTDEWQQESGRNSAEITDGVLRISVETPPTLYSATSPVFEDFDVSVTTRSIEGAMENEGYGIIFRLQAEASEECSRGAILICGLAEMPLVKIPVRLLFPQSETGATGFHVFLISNDGYYSIWSSNDQNQLEKVTVWHYSNGLINEGLDAENRLRVVGRGDEFRFYINGQTVELCIPNEGEQPTGNAENCLGEKSFVWQNDKLERGQVGLIVNVNAVPDIVVEFDNFTVFSPESELGAGDQL